MSAWHYLIKGCVVIKAFENTKQWINRLGSFFHLEMKIWFIILMTKGWRGRTILNKVRFCGRLLNGVYNFTRPLFLATAICDFNAYQTYFKTFKRHRSLEHYRTSILHVVIVDQRPIKRQSTFWSRVACFDCYGKLSVSLTNFSLDQEFRIQLQENRVLSRRED